jgi:predicted nuclease of predicted toxin-antitoxin system
MDVHVRRAVTSALRLRSIDVLTAQEDGAAELDDDRLLQRATELGRVLVSQDEDLLREGARLLKDGKRVSRHHLRPPASGHDWPDGGRS